MIEILRNLCYDLRKKVNSIKGFFIKKRAWRRLRAPLPADEFDLSLEIDSQAICHMAGEERTEYLLALMKRRAEVHEFD